MFVSIFVAEFNQSNKTIKKKKKKGSSNKQVINFNNYFNKTK